jgi:hypothetical protein
MRTIVETEWREKKKTFGKWKHKGRKETCLDCNEVLSESHFCCCMNHMEHGVMYSGKHECRKHPEGEGT